MRSRYLQTRPTTRQLEPSAAMDDRTETESIRREEGSAAFRGHRSERQPVRRPELKWLTGQRNSAAPYRVRIPDPSYARSPRLSPRTVPPHQDRDCLGPIVHREHPVLLADGNGDVRRHDAESGPRDRRERMLTRPHQRDAMTYGPQTQRKRPSAPTAGHRSDPAVHAGRNRNLTDGRDGHIPLPHACRV